jgi:hypothetical protein
LLAAQAETRRGSDNQKLSQELAPRKLAEYPKAKRRIPREATRKIIHKY